MIQKIINFFRTSFKGFTRAKKEIKTEIFLGYNHTTEELEILRLINEYRLTLKLRQLYTNSYLSYKCEQHNLEMIAADKVSHNGSEKRFSEIIKYLKCVAVAENVAYDYKSPQGVFDAWIRSDSHRDNIVGDFMEFGVSARKDLEGKIYYTNIFIK